MNYQQFLDSKLLAIESKGITVLPADLNANLFEFQRDIVVWALRLGKAAVFAQCGLGKSLIELTWAEQINGQVLILAPLAVAAQTVREGIKFGITVKQVGEQSDIEPTDHILVTNYERLHKFDCAQFEGVVLDESSILKSFSSATRNQLIQTFARTPYKLACTATPAPNDYVELGNHAEFLGVMDRTQMLAEFFTHDGGDTSKWRLKGHAEEVFWRWVSQWGVMVRTPADFGYSCDGYDLPPIHWVSHNVENDLIPDDGQLFKLEASTLNERRQARRQSLSERVKAAAALVNASSEQWLVWCDLNDEGMALAQAIDGAVEVAGRHDNDTKESALLRFARGEIRVLVSKPSICGFGMNFQNCHNIAFVGLSDSYEALHQAISRCHRFGQQHQVTVHLITARSEGAVLKNIKRKEKDALKMSDAMAEHISVHQNLGQTQRQSNAYQSDRVTGLGWELHLGDCVQVVKALDANSIHYSIFSPPFASLYVYSNSNRDMGNCRTMNEFMQHFQFLVTELYRVLMPGRLLSFHCMNLPSSKQNDGYIGIKDFRGDLIRLFQEAGFIFHSEVCIWKDPVMAMQRTKAIGLLHKQLKKDSALSRQGIPDYLVTMRKPGDNLQPITGKLTHYTGENLYNLPTEKSEAIEERAAIEIWQRYASPVWMDVNPSRTLQRNSARDEKDERHICPLQLDVIERALQLWSNPGDLVLSPFTGIGSEGYVALKMNRRFMGIELKQSYFEQAQKNLDSVSSFHQQELLTLA